MKLGLLTIYSVPNFGSVLQAYATQYILEQLGHECKIINYRYPNERQRVVKPDLKTRLYSVTSKLGLVPQQRKSKKLRKFRTENYNFTKPYNSFEDLKAEKWDEYDGFVVGSDQVWNTRYTKGEPAFLLSFVPDDKKRFSIASSFASNELPQEYVEQFKFGLKNFNAISVREKEGKKIIRTQLGIDKEVFVCLDPTLLLNRNQWQLLTKKSNGLPTQPYILYYMWAYAFEPRPYINDVVKYFKEKTGINTVIALEGAPRTNIEGIKYLNKESSTIPEFIDLFANASLVITSSFHGTAFALNFGRPLISVVPYLNGDDRQSSLLKAVEADSSIVQLNTPLDVISPYYDEEKVSNNLNKLRNESLSWVKNNINQYYGTLGKDYQ